MTQKFRKKPVVIEAVQYKGSGNFDNPALPEWIWKAFETRMLFPQPNGCDPLQIQTLEGILTVANDDYIIQGVNGEIYPCKPDIFKNTYTPIDAASQNNDGWASKEEYKHALNRIGQLQKQLSEAQLEIRDANERFLNQ